MTLFFDGEWHKDTPSRPLRKHFPRFPSQGRGIALSPGGHGEATLKTQGDEGQLSSQFLSFSRSRTRELWRGGREGKSGQRLVAQARGSAPARTRLPRAARLATATSVPSDSAHSFSVPAACHLVPEMRGFVSYWLPPGEGVSLRAAGQGQRAGEFGECGRLEPRGLAPDVAGGVEGPPGRGQAGFVGSEEGRVASTEAQRGMGDTAGHARGARPSGPLRTSAVLILGWLELRALTPQEGRPLGQVPSGREGWGPPPRCSWPPRAGGTSTVGRTACPRPHTASSHRGRGRPYVWPSPVQVAVCLTAWASCCPTPARLQRWP